MKLRELRTQNHISQDRLAKELNVGRTTITNYESGESKPDIEMVKKIANYFNVSIDYLLDNEQQKEPENIEFKKEYNFTEKQEEILEYVKQLDDYQCKVAKVYFQTLLNDFQESEISQNKSKTEWILFLLLENTEVK